jgi:hypothetical protein
MARLTLHASGSPKKIARISKGKSKKGMPPKQAKAAQAAAAAPKLSQARREPASSMAASPMTPAVDDRDWTGIGSIAMTTLLKTNDVMMNGMVAWSQEMMDFTQARLQKAATRSEELLHCTDPTAAFNLQRDFALRAAREYLEEAGKLTTMGMQVASQYWTPFAEGSRETLSHVGENRAGSGKMRHVRWQDR